MLRVQEERSGAGRRAADQDVFSAVADPTRRRIIQMLAAGDRPVNEVAAAFAISRPAVSRHLRVLRVAGVVRERRVGRERLYRLRPQGLAPAAVWFRRLDRFWRRRLAALGHLLDREET